MSAVKHQAQYIYHTREKFLKLHSYTAEHFFQGGIVSPIKFLYNVGDRISLECRHGMIAVSMNRFPSFFSCLFLLNFLIFNTKVGSASAECTSRGEWSGDLPSCVDYRE